MLFTPALVLLLVTTSAPLVYLLWTSVQRIDLTRRLRAKRPELLK